MLKFTSTTKTWPSLGVMVLNKIYSSKIFWALVISLAFTCIPVFYWNSQHKASTGELITLWGFLSFSCVWLVYLRKKQPLVCLIGAPFLAIIGIAVFLNFIRQADASTMAFAPISAAIFQLIGLGVIVAISAFTSKNS